MPDVANVKFSKKDTGELFGLSPNGLPIGSEDGGYSWMAVLDQEYQDAMADVNKMCKVKTAEKS